MVCLFCIRPIQNSSSHTNIGMAMIQTNNAINRLPKFPASAKKAEIINAAKKITIAASAAIAAILFKFFFIIYGYLSILSIIIIIYNKCKLPFDFLVRLVYTSYCSCIITIYMFFCINRCSGIITINVLLWLWKIAITPLIYAQTFIAISSRCVLFVERKIWHILVTEGINCCIYQDFSKKLLRSITT